MFEELLNSFLEYIEENDLSFSGYTERIEEDSKILTIVLDKSKQTQGELSNIFPDYKKYIYNAISAFLGWVVAYSIINLIF